MMQSRDSGVIGVDRRGHVVVIRIQRPEVRNALNLAVLEGLRDSLAEADRDDSVRVIVLTGGEGDFSAGADIDMLSGQTSAGYARSVNARCFKEIRRTEKPLVAAVSGFCLGGGCEIALACDVVIASDTARLGQPEIRLGIIPGAGGTQLWRRRAGDGVQSVAALGGAAIGAFTARRAGLVDRVVPCGGVIEEACQFGAELAKNGPLALPAAKRVMRASWNMSLSGTLDHEVSVMAGLLSSSDAAEGIAAFQQKRPPVFEGR
ncbi:enoyl-CoA hydratase/isomerase family protein [Paracoccus sediminicola]|uniref:enoyl-CoA hydratase/isomerase family protein n=1 Tax=Paracoccus sediminicola TaxID=3017783 RepID=UPI0022F00C6F|nr:enoyl-CoA hydratase/isomerase family protein [Paracoccus sediminicola]WBU56220.1 enoyl-CoA hydratase/isomerase family protein [Paracoccus sediminicola]